MKRISVVVASAFIGLLSLVGFADAGGHGSAGVATDQTRQQAAVGAGSYIKEVFTTLDQAQSYNQSAVKVFFHGETIAFVGRVYLANPSQPLPVYTIITNAAGQTVLLDGFTHNPSSADYAFWLSDNTLPVGTYFLNVLVASADGILLSPASFPFVVQ